MKICRVKRWWPSRSCFFAGSTFSTAERKGAGVEGLGSLPEWKNRISPLGLASSFSHGRNRDFQLCITLKDSFVWPEPMEHSKATVGTPVSHFAYQEWEGVVGSRSRNRNKRRSWTLPIALLCCLSEQGPVTLLWVPALWLGANHSCSHYNTDTTKGQQSSAGLQEDWPLGRDPASGAGLLPSWLRELRSSPPLWTPGWKMLVGTNEAQRCTVTS